MGETSVAELMPSRGEGSDGELGVFGMQRRIVTEPHQRVYAERIDLRHVWRLRVSDSSSRCCRVGEGTG